MNTRQMNKQALQDEIKEIERQLRKYNKAHNQLEDLLTDVAYEEAFNSSYGFLQHSWNTFEPSQFKHGKHLAAIAEHLDACLRGEITKLIINISPRNCLAYDTLISLADGTHKTINQIKPGDTVISCTPSGVVTTDTVKDTWSTGTQTLYRIWLKDGSYVDATQEHRLHSWDKWVKVSDLKEGDCLTVANTLTRFEEPAIAESLSVDDAFLLALYLAEGSKSCTQRPNYTYKVSNNQEEIHQRASEIAAQRGWTITWEEPGLTFRLVNYEKGNTPYKQVVVKHKAERFSTYNVRIPECVFLASREAQLEFISTYISCDGYIAKHNQCVAISSISRKLVEDFQLLLKQFGVHSNIVNKPVKYKGKKYYAYDLCLTTVKAIRWCKENLNIYSKQHKLDNYDLSLKTKTTTRDIPPIWRNSVVKKRTDGKHNTLSKRGWTSLDVVLAVAKDQNNHELITKITSGIGWKKIVKIEQVGETETFDIETEKHNCFFANGILSHNSKTAICSVAFPAYIWLKQPQKKIINIGYSLELATGNSMSSRNIIQSDWWAQGMKQVWLPMLKQADPNFKEWSLRSDSNQKHHYTNTVGGSRYAVGLEGTIYGKGGDILIADDPLNPRYANSKTYREKTNNLLSQMFATRINDRDNSIRILIAQRLCEGDSTDYFLEQGGWEHLVIPMEWDESRRYWTSIGWTDWRTKDGELMNPNRFDRKAVNQLKHHELTPYDWAAQHQQLPAPIGGGIIKVEWFKEWYYLPKTFDATCMAFDLSMKEGADNDNTALIVMGRKDSKFYVIDLIYAKMDILKQMDAIQHLCDKYPYIRTRLVEKKANGDAILSLLKRTVTGLVPVEPQRDINKEQRLMSTIPEIYAGNVHLPTKDQCPQIKNLLEECSLFPKGKHDDALDAFYYGMNHLIEAVSTTIIPDAKLNEETKHRIQEYQTVKQELNGTGKYNTKIELSRSYVQGLFGI